MSEPGAFPDAAGYGRSLDGLTVNLLVSDLAGAIAFQTGVLGAVLAHRREGFAVMRGYGGEWMLHEDSTYQRHPLRGLAQGVDARGAGIELRLHGCDPDAAEARARRAGALVLDAAADKPHGLREVYLVDGDGFVWVPDRPTAD